MTAHSPSSIRLVWGHARRICQIRFRSRFLLSRIQKLIALQKEITHKRYAEYIGQVHNVLVEEASRRDENQMAGKNEYNITVNFPGDKSLVGQIVKVKITSAGRKHAARRTRGLSGGVSRERRI